jgi:hypothetical protein
MIQNGLGIGAAVQCLLGFQFGLLHVAFDDGLG